jgi:hypothetical protein
VWVQVPSSAYLPKKYSLAVQYKNAGVAELADAQASGACGRKIVWVQVPSPAFFFYEICENPSLFGKHTAYSDRGGFLYLINLQNNAIL